jgi:hypothetical protein
VAGTFQSLLDISLGFQCHWTTYQWNTAGFGADYHSLGMVPWDIAREEFYKFNVLQLSVQQTEIAIRNISKRLSNLYPHELQKRGEFLTFNISCQLWYYILPFLYGSGNFGKRTEAINVIHPLLSNLLWQLLVKDYDIINATYSVFDRILPSSLSNPNIRKSYGFTYLQMGALVDEAVNKLKDLIVSRLNPLTVTNIIKAIVKKISGESVQIVDKGGVVVNVPNVKVNVPDVVVNVPDVGNVDDVVNLLAPKNITLHSNIAHVDTVFDQFITFVNETGDQRTFLVRDTEMDTVRCWFRNNKNEIIDLHSDETYDYRFVLELELETDK